MRILFPPHHGQTSAWRALARLRVAPSSWEKSSRVPGPVTVFVISLNPSISPRVRENGNLAMIWGGMAIFAIRGILVKSGREIISPLSMFTEQARGGKNRCFFSEERFCGVTSFSSLPTHPFEPKFQNIIPPACLNLTNTDWARKCHFFAVFPTAV